MRINPNAPPPQPGATQVIPPPSMGGGGGSSSWDVHISNALNSQLSPIDTSVDLSPANYSALTRDFGTPDGFNDIRSIMNEARGVSDNPFTDADMARQEALIGQSNDAAANQAKARIISRMGGSGSPGAQFLMMNADQGAASNTAGQRSDFNLAVRDAQIKNAMNRLGLSGGLAQAILSGQVATRGQDVSVAQALQAARMQARGQDLSARTAEMQGGLTARGQDSSHMLGQGSIAMSGRGQDFQAQQEAARLAQQAQQFALDQALERERMAQQGSQFDAELAFRQGGSDRDYEFRMKQYKDKLRERLLDRRTEFGQVPPANDGSFFLRRQAAEMPMAGTLGNMFGSQMGADPISTYHNMQLANARQALGQKNFTVHGGGANSYGQATAMQKASQGRAPMPSWWR